MLIRPSESGVRRGLTRFIRVTFGALLMLALTDAVLDFASNRFAAPQQAGAAAPRLYTANEATHEADSSRAVLGMAPAGGAAEASLRLRRHADAERAFRNFTLFRNGRGMHAAAGAELMYDQLAQNKGWKGRLSRQWLGGRTGLIFDESHRTVGFADVEYSGARLIAQNCNVCHTGKVLGQIVTGLGNKNIDPFALASLGEDFERNTAAISSLLQATGSHRPHSQSSEFCGRVANRQLGNLTQGMVPVSVIWSWFYRQGDRPLPETMSRAAVKVPALWGYSEKRKVGLFCDAIGDGRSVGWMAAVELIGGQDADTVRGYAQDLEAIGNRFADLLPPAYPLPIDGERARRGKQLFTAHCQQCHGTYEKDSAGIPIYQPPAQVEWAEVLTDDDRLKNSTSEFLKLVAANPLADVLRANPNYVPGYIAPRLEGIWARFPYLHNGSVPNLAALLTAPEHRPDRFSLKNAGEAERFDPQQLGLTTPTMGSREEAELARAARRGDRDIYDAGRVGHSNRGHDFATTLSSAEKQSLIEYLKTL